MKKTRRLVQATKTFEQMAKRSLLNRRHVSISSNKIMSKTATVNRRSLINSYSRTTKLATMHQTRCFVRSKMGH